MNILVFNFSPVSPLYRYSDPSPGYPVYSNYYLISSIDILLNGVASILWLVTRLNFSHIPSMSYEIVILDGKALGFKIRFGTIPLSVWYILSEFSKYPTVLFYPNYEQLPTKIPVLDSEWRTHITPSYYYPIETQYRSYGSIYSESLYIVIHESNSLSLHTYSYIFLCKSDILKIQSGNYPLLWHIALYIMYSLILNYYPLSNI